MKLGKAVATGYAEERAEAREQDVEETVEVRDEAPVAVAPVAVEPEPATAG
ncbi:hypothetical protein AB0M28_22525 [Streptomyces sp. NPDC051940]|uniref:hypothetical protein n=1 Tax=Streptomyces sp. NPDC051940 TaxID=3155675 RepID=UPI003433EAED